MHMHMCHVPFPVLHMHMLQHMLLKELYLAHLACQATRRLHGAFLLFGPLAGGG